VLLIAAAYSFWVLLRGISAAASAGDDASRMARVRAGWRGYWSLRGTDFLQAILAPVLLALFIAGLVWLVVFSPMRF